MTTVLLVRHGRSTANTSGLLAGRTPGIALDAKGGEQAGALAERLGALPLAAIVSSPLQRCLETTAPLVAATGIRVAKEKRLAECDYGDWTGRSIKELMKEKLWKVVQAHPSAVAFPGGESMAGMAARAAAAVRDWDERLTASHGPDAVWVACSHADLIKAVVADAMGVHLDLFQRIMIDPGSVTAIRYTDTRPFLLKANDTGGDVAAYRPPARTRRSSRGDAVVGGGAGPKS